MMVFTKCGHCNGTATKIAYLEPQGAQHKQVAICCGSCNAILGITGYYDLGTLLKQQEKEIAALREQMARMEQALRQVRRALQP